jgi:ADP-ribose pyrophosphatase
MWLWGFSMRSRIVQDEVIYTGKVCRVHKIGLKMDTGDVVTRDLIEFGNAVVVVPVLADGSVVLIRNERFAVGENLYEFPAGKIDGDEAPEACAARELTEETGYTAGRLEKLGGFYSCPGAVTEYLHAFAATELTEGPQMLEEYERIEIELAGPGRIDDMIRSGELHDAKSISAWAMWRLMERT